MRRSLVVALLLAAGCTQRVALTRELRHTLDPEDFKNLQIYTSHDITFRRVMKVEERGVTEGHYLRIEKDKRIEEVEIPAFTPGLVIGTKDEQLLVSFEPPVQGREVSLVFAPAIRFGRKAYYLVPEASGERSDVILYAGIQWTVPLESRWAFLMIDESRGNNTERRTRELPGRRVRDEDPK